MKKPLLVLLLLIISFSAFSQGPSITSFSPGTGTTGTVITITGTGFTEVTAVNFGGTPARSFTVNSPTSVTAVVGSGSSGAVEVVTTEGTANFSGFTFQTPAVTLTKVSDGAEGGGNVRFMVSYPEGYEPAQSTSISYQVSGAAESGTDFAALSGTVAIPAGSASALIEVAITDDGMLEGSEEIAILLVSAASDGTPVQVAPAGAVSAAITDNDTSSTVSLSLVNSGAEPGTDALFRISFPDGITSSVPTTVTYEAGGTATAGTDYTTLSGTLTIPAGENSADLLIPIEDDTDFEGAETVTITLEQATNAVAAVGVSAGTVSAGIADNDEDPANSTITLTRVSNGGEGGDNIVFRVSFPAGVTRPAATEVSYSVGGTATAGTDHSGANGNVVIPAGSNSADIEIDIADDQVIELPETVTVTLTGAVSQGTELNVDRGGPVSAALGDNDNTSANAITVTAVSDGAEPGTNPQFRISLPQGVTSSAAITVTYQLTGSASAGSDYAAVPGSVTIPAGTTGVTLPVTVTDDEQFEPSETVVLTLQSASSQIGEHSVNEGDATVTITDNDQNPADNVISLTRITHGSEGGSGAGFRASYPAGITRAFATQVSYEVTGSATPGADFTAPGGSLTIPAGQNSADLVIPVTNDQVIEPNETIVITLRSATVPPDVTTAVTVNQEPVTANITDNDNNSTNTRLTLTAVSNAAEPATNGQFRISFPPGITSSAGTTVNYRVGGTATSGADYSALPGSLTIPAGSNDAIITITITDDNVYEGGETVQLTLLSAISDLAEHSVNDQPVSVSITDNDENPADNVLSLARLSHGVEGGAAARFRVSYPTGISKTFNTVVSYNVTGSGTPGSDYTSLSGSLTIPAGQNSAELTVPIANDLVIEPVETLVLALRAASVPPDVTTVVTVSEEAVSANITDNDNNSTNNRILVTTVSNGAEPAVNGSVRVGFPEGITSSGATVVNLSLAGTAASGSDYRAISGPVTIPANTNSVVLEIQILDDQVLEGNETISLALQNAANPVATPAVSTGAVSLVIADDDNRAPFNIITLTRVRDGSEPGTSPGFRVGFPENITSSSNTTLTFSIGGTAVNGTDYTALPATAVIPAGENAAMINLGVIDDQVIEGTETVVLALTAAVSADTSVAVASGASSITISDNDHTVRNNVLALIKESDAAEPMEDARFTIRYPDGISSAAATTISYNIAGTATNGTDYGQLSGTVIIPAGSNSAEIRVAVLDDQEIEITETVALTLRAASSPVSPTIGFSTTASVIANIADNDSSTPNTIALTKVQDGSEPSSNPVFRVSFPAGITSSAVTVINYSVGGTAGNGADYSTLPGSVIIPAGSNSADITVTVTDDQLVDPDESVDLVLTSVSNSLTVLSTFPATPVRAIIKDDDVPAILSFTPASGPGGTTVTISGSRFDPQPANNVVFFGAVRGSVTAATPTSLRVTVPAGATFQPLTVTVNGLSAASATPFAVTFANDAAIDSRAFALRTDITPGNTPLNLAAADFNGDGRVDFFTANHADQTVSVLQNSISGGMIRSEAFSGRRDFPANGKPLNTLIADLDGDGKPDGLVISEIDQVTDTTYLVSIYLNTSTADSASFAPGIDLIAAAGVRRADIADINGDGRPDLVTLNQDDSRMTVFRNTGTPGTIAFERAAAFSAGSPQDLAVGDFNGDHKPDVAVTDQSSGRILVLRNTSTGGSVAFDGSASFPAVAAPFSVAAADLNRDGAPDLAVMSRSGIISVLRNTGTGGNIAFGPAVDLPAGNGPGHFSAGDVDGDGRPELVAVSGDPGVVSVFRNTGTATAIAFSGPVTFPAGKGPGSLRIADLNNDGKPELSISNPGDKTLSILQNTIDQPVLSSFSPELACIGTEVTLTGSNLSGASAVMFGSTAATSFTVVSSTTIRVIVPSGADGEVRVTTPKGIAARSGFTAVPVPGISAGGSTTFASGGQVVLTATTGEGYSYLWQRDGVDLAGATGRSYTASETGSYRIRILDGNCGSVSEPVAVNVVFTLPANNFTVSATGETCRTSNNGEIGVSAVRSLNYTATLTGSGTNLSTRFTETARFRDLPAGTYNICLSVDGQPDYRLCYDVVVSEPEDLAVYTAVDPVDNTLDLMLSGSDLYHIELNGEKRSVKQGRVTLPLKQGTNRLKVSTGQECQGVIERVIQVGATASIYPNPFENILNLSLAESASGNARVEIMNSSGRVVYSGKFTNGFGSIRMELPELVAGIYFLKLSLEGSESVYKIIRK